MGFRRWFLRRKDRPLVRPWALLTPIAVLLIALPLLRPLRHPDARETSDQERAILAPVQSVVEHHTLAIEATNFTLTHNKVDRNGHTYSTQAPTFPVLLSGSYWAMNRFWGVNFDGRPDVVAYFLTLLGSTLPVALSAGLVYRMGRLFELKRHWRAALALSSVLATGFISYATVLNPHAPAAAAILCSAACLIHLTITNRRIHASVWLVLAGLCAALAAAIDPPAVIFLLLFFPVVFAFRWPLPQRLAAGFAFVAGAAGPILMHVLLSTATGAAPLEVAGFGPHAQARIANLVAPSATTSPIEAWAAQHDDDDQPAANPLQRAAAGTWRVLRALCGPHGLLSHFPVLLLGIVGVTMVMHRHWPPVTKLLASATLGGGAAILVSYAIGDGDWGDAMFATRFFVVFLPLTLFWAGAWLRRSHRPGTWALAATLVLFSTAVSLVGATGPLPPGGFQSDNNGKPAYTASAALRNLLHPQPEEIPPTVAAGAY